MKKIRKKAFTLVEVMVATSLISFSTFSLFLLLQKMKQQASENIIKNAAISVAQSRLTQIMALPFEDPDRNRATDLTSKLRYHTPDGSGENFIFNQITSGIYPTGTTSLDVTTGLTLITPLSDSIIGWKQKYSSVINKNSTNPFPLDSRPFKSISSFIGKENSDMRRKANDFKNTFWMVVDEKERSTLLNTGLGLVFADDVDDFDGCYYTIPNIYSNVNFLVEVAVRPHFRNYGNSTAIPFHVTIDGISYTCNLKNENEVIPPFGDMGLEALEDGSLSLSRLDSSYSKAITPSLSSLSEADKRKVLSTILYKLYTDYCLFKQIIVSVSWSIPPDTSKRTVSVYGIVPNNKNLADKINE